MAKEYQKYVRTTALWAAVLVLSAVLSRLPFIGGCLTSASGLVAFVALLWMILMAAPFVLRRKLPARAMLVPIAIAAASLVLAIAINRASSYQLSFEFRTNRADYQRVVRMVRERAARPQDIGVLGELASACEVMAPVTVEADPAGHWVAFDHGFSEPDDGRLGILWTDRPIPEDRHLGQWLVEGDLAPNWYTAWN